MLEESHDVRGTGGAYNAAQVDRPEFSVRPFDRELEGSFAAIVLEA